MKTHLASKSSIIFAMRLLGAGLVVLAQAGIARLWGGEALGEYLLVMAVINLVAMVMPLGFQTIGTYFAAEYRAGNHGNMLWRFMLQSYAHVALVGGSLALIGVFVAPQVGAFVLPGGLFDFLSDLSQYWVQGCIIAIAVSIVFVNGSVLVGLKRPYAGFFADGLFRPLLVIFAFAIATMFGAPDERLGAMLWSFALGYGVVALVHSLVVVNSIKSMPHEDTNAGKETSRWWRFALPWVLIDLATLYFFDIDLIVLSSMMDRETLAIFGVCTRMFSLMAFGVTAVYAVSLPDMFEAAKSADRKEFLQKLGDANFVAMVLSAALFGGILLVGPIVLMIFGDAFIAGTIPLAILSLALVVRSAFGPAALVLSLHDRPWASLPSIGAGMVTLVVGNYLLVPIFGLMGAALSALAAFTIWSVLMWWTALVRTKTDVSIFPRLRQIIGPKPQAEAAE